MARAMWLTGPVVLEKEHQKAWWVIVRFPKKLSQGAEKNFQYFNIQHLYLLFAGDMVFLVSSPSALKLNKTATDR